MIIWKIILNVKSFIFANVYIFLYFGYICMWGGKKLIRINFLDGTYIDISSDTHLVGISRCSRKTKSDCSFRTREYNWFDNKGLGLSTVDERLGVTGFILSYDCFSVGNNADDTVYLQSAVKSVTVI